MSWQPFDDQSSSATPRRHVPFALKWAIIVGGLLVSAIVVFAYFMAPIVSEFGEALGRH
jgi:hypothetical protein